ncbi:S24/S26 family peptidase [Nocardioides sp.]|uniref:S24/S26 family peptidase n=1 Tax=Nocardioides sp. TaxID=35761 RepID=UPI002721C55F|nr:S24/S26 family peptidase [Nocardioides sp.]MDO9457384.1 S24/S26 family peptidase [Nocardioides sp.]
MSDRRSRPHGVVVVRGRSMLPGLREGDRLLVRYGVPPAAGDVVVARFRDGTVVVKRAAERRRTASDGPGWWLLSDNADEGVADSRARGVVPDADVLAVARWRLWPRPGRLRRLV